MLKAVNGERSEGNLCLELLPNNACPCRGALQLLHLLDNGIHRSLRLAQRFNGDRNGVLHRCTRPTAFCGSETFNFDTRFFGFVGKQRVFFGKTFCVTFGEVAGGDDALVAVDEIFEFLFGEVEVGCIDGDFLVVF